MYHVPNHFPAQHNLDSDTVISMSHVSAGPPRTCHPLTPPPPPPPAAAPLIAPLTPPTTTRPATNECLTRDLIALLDKVIQRIPNSSSSDAAPTTHSVLVAHPVVTAPPTAATPAVNNMPAAKTTTAPPAALTATAPLASTLTTSESPWIAVFVVMIVVLGVLLMISFVILLRMGRKMKRAGVRRGSRR